MQNIALRLSLITGLLLALLNPSIAQTSPAALAFTCPPYLQNLHENGITVAWAVSGYAVSRVEYGESQQLDQKAHHARYGMVDVGSGIQKVALTGLKPATRYYYRVVSKEVKTHQAYKVVYGDSIQSPVYSFTTPSAVGQNFSFLAFNDIHSKPAFTQSILQRENNIGFVMLNGDILNDINRESDIVDNMLRPFSTYFATTTPFFFTRGNHETRGAGARALPNYIDTPTGNFYYSFTYGNTHFVVLDCGEDKPDTHPAYFGLADYDRYRSQEAEWLQQEVQTKAYRDAAFRVICIHMPVALAVPDKEAEGWGVKECSRLFGPILNRAGADLLLCGHTHTYTVIRPLKGITTFPIIVGGGPYTDGSKTTYTLVEVKQNLLTATLKKASGEVIDKVEVKSSRR